LCIHKDIVHNNKLVGVESSKAQKHNITLATIGQYKYGNIKYEMASPWYREDALKGLEFIAHVLTKMYNVALDSLGWRQVWLKLKKYT
jgi:hypothetical protein